jgi:hypothetical protein
MIQDIDDWLKDNLPMEEIEEECEDDWWDEEE